jgi:hypothetical protein
MDFVRKEYYSKERSKMKFRILFLLIGICAIPSLPARLLPPLPEPAFVDGEVSRCYSFDQSFANILATPPSWIYDTRWDLVRLTRRGRGANDVVLAMDILNRGGLFLVR